MTTTQVHKPAPPNPDPRVRRLKIEEDGDPWKGKVRPKMRLQGSWLKRAGFKQGNYVHVKCVALGVMQLHSSDSEPASTAQ
jgi:hypothetical protein